MLQLNFILFPVLETERLILRKISMDDAPDLFVLRTNEDAMKYINKPLPKSIDEIKVLIKNMNEITERIQWAIALKTENKIVGTIGYHRIEKEHYRAEVGYMLHPDYWNTGLMTEALKVIIDFGFDEMNLHSIEGNINPNNAVSRKILEKFGFVKEAYFKENYFFNGKFFDSEVYSLLKR